MACWPWAPCGGDCAGVGLPRAAKHLQSTARGSPRPQSRHGRGRAVSRAARGRRDGCLTALHTTLSPNIGHLAPNCVAGHCRYATALHGRQLSLLQMEGAYRGVERGQRPRSSLNARSVFRPPRFLRNLATYRERVVRELLSHYNNDPLQQGESCVWVCAPRTPRCESRNCLFLLGLRLPVACVRPSALLVCAVIRAPA